MTLLQRSLLTCGLVLPLAAAQYARATASQPRMVAAGSGATLFRTTVRPVLVQTCFKCHAGNRAASGLKVDSRAGLLKGGRRGPAIVPGSPQRSLLLKAISYHDPELKMPPNRKLSTAQIAAVSKWIKLGAPWPAN